MGIIPAMLLLGLPRVSSSTRSEESRASIDVEVAEGPRRQDFCPRCGLTVARPDELTPHLFVCSGTS